MSLSSVIDQLPLADLIGSTEMVVVVYGAVLVALVGLVRRLRGPRPVAGEVWFAEVPFEDRAASKDRPVLVLAGRGRRRTVARFTSQDRTARRDHRRVPDGVGGLRRDSWVDLRPLVLPRSAFRRRIGSADAALLDWYEREAQSAR